MTKRDWSKSEAKNYQSDQNTGESKNMLVDMVHINQQGN